MSETFEPSPPNSDRNPSNLTALKVPPHSVEAEQAVLGGLMVDNTEWDNVADLLVPEDFYRPEHQLVFQTMIDLFENRKPIDVVTIAEALSLRGEIDVAGGLDYLGELAGNSRGTANFETYSEIIRERAILRRLISAANQIADSCYSPKEAIPEIVNAAEKRVFDLNNERQVEGPEHIKDIVMRTVDRIDELAGLDGELTGLSTGFTDLDKITSGWQKSDLVIVAGRPSMGKTAFAMNLVENAILKVDEPVVVFSLEMPAESLVMRMLSSMGKIDQTRLRSGQITDSDWDGFNKAVGLLKEKNLHIDDSAGITPLEMRARLRRIQTSYRNEQREAASEETDKPAKKEKGIGLVVVDYLQLMQLKTTTENRVGEISEISRSLKVIAREFECPVIALSQLNRGLEQRPNKRPVMSDLRESGAIEQDADIITFIYRDEVYNEDSPDKGIAEVIIGKHRNGPIGTVRLSFLGQFTRFENHAQPRYDDSYTHG